MRVQDPLGFARRAGCIADNRQIFFFAFFDLIFNIAPVFGSEFTTHFLNTGNTFQKWLFVMTHASGIIVDDVFQMRAALLEV